MSESELEKIRKKLDTLEFTVTGLLLVNVILVIIAFFFAAGILKIHIA